ncbi:MAG: MlaE family lipid ABC transporter permease subunit [Candidatus Omnitrophota bacterium]|nr:MlaE family lipid ABC transporter permease subunit [Candidatus Omnitrophota bacterium]
MGSEKLSFDYSAPKTLHIKLCGDWQIYSDLPMVSAITPQLAVHTDIRQITFDLSKLGRWDSGLVSFLLQLVRECERRNIRVTREGLPEGIEKLLALALTINKKIIPRQVIHESFFERVGGRMLQVDKNIRALLDFLGQIAVSFGRLIKGKSYFRRDDFFFIVQRSGVDALPLVSLISILVGMILAFIGAIQLQMFGAQIFIADIVGIAMVRVMGAVMTGVLMAGRTGASFAAELGIMQTNEEIDALKTLGVSPVEYLVMPRLLALIIMMPLLTIYADLMGILGGFIISVGMLNINPVEYLNHTYDAVKLNNLWVGLIHSFVFGVIIAVTGCLRGIKCDRSAAGVGEATTSAVVSGITGIVIATAIITFICQVLGV